MKHDEIDRELAEALDSLREVPLPDEGRQAAHRASFLAGARAQAVQCLGKFPIDFVVLHISPPHSP